RAPHHHYVDAQARSHRGRHHPPNGTPEKSIEPCRFTVPPAFSPTKFLWRLRAPKTLTSFGISDLIAESEGVLLHLQYSYAAPFGPALLVTQGTLSRSWPAPKGCLFVGVERP